MVLVAMGNEQAANAVFIFNQVRHIGDDQVNAVHVPVREAHTAVYHNEFAAVFVDGHILADFVKSAQGNNFHFFCQNIALLFNKQYYWKEKRNANRREGPLDYRTQHRGFSEGRLPLCMEGFAYHAARGAWYNYSSQAHPQRPEKNQIKHSAAHRPRGYFI